MRIVAAEPIPCIAALRNLPKRYGPVSHDPDRPRDGATHRAIARVWFAYHTDTRPIGSTEPSKGSHEQHTTILEDPSAPLHVDWPAVHALRRGGRCPASDLSHGWGHNSQWRTDFRRDYEESAELHYNVDGRWLIGEPLPEGEEDLASLPDEIRQETVPIINFHDNGNDRLRLFS